MHADDHEHFKITLSMNNINLNDIEIRTHLSLGDLGYIAYMHGRNMITNATMVSALISTSCRDWPILPPSIILIKIAFGCVSIRAIL